jgi:hypothetical protein
MRSVGEPNEFPVHSKQPNRRAGAAVEERKASQYGTPEARNFRQMEKAEEAPELSSSTSLRSILIWRLVTLVALGAPFSYLKRVINVVRELLFNTHATRCIC